MVVLAVAIALLEMVLVLLSKFYADISVEIIAMPICSLSTNAFHYYVFLLRYTTQK